MKLFFSLHFCFLCVADFVPMEGVADFPVDIHNFLAAPGIPDCPPIYEPLQSPVDSDLSCPPSPSPVSSPSPNSSSSSSESGIEDVSDMEESTSFLAANGSLLVKMENPSSPLNGVNLPVPKRRAIKRRFKKENDSSVLEELNKLLVETSVSLALTSTDQSLSQPCQTQAKLTSEGSIQTTALPTSYTCPLIVEANQTTIASESLQLSLSSQTTTTSTLSTLSTPPPVVSQSRIRSKPTRNHKKSDEPKIVIIEEPEEVFSSWIPKVIFLVFLFILLRMSCALQSSVFHYFSFFNFSILTIHLSICAELQSQVWKWRVQRSYSWLSGQFFPCC